MGVQCAHCGKTTDMPYKCKYCGGRYCPEHRLPEGHTCDGVEFLSATGKRFETKTGTVVNSGESVESPEPMEIEETVGTTPEIEDEKSPPVRLKSDQEETKAQETEGSRTLLSIAATIKKLLPL